MSQDPEKFYCTVGGNFFEIFTRKTPVLKPDVHNVYDQPAKAEPTLLNFAAFISNLTVIKPDYFDAKVLSFGEGLAIRYEANDYFAGNMLSKINVTHFGPERIEFHINKNNRAVSGNGLRYACDEGVRIRVEWDSEGYNDSDIACDYVVYSINPTECWEEHEGVVSPHHLVSLIRDMLVRYMERRNYTSDIRVFKSDLPVRYVEVDWDLDEDVLDPALIEDAPNLPRVVRILATENLNDGCDALVDRLSEEYGYCINALSPVL